MKIWQVAAQGEGFQRNGSNAAFELSGFILAATADEAFTKAVHIAKQQFVELGQAGYSDHPRAVINADEIEEFSGVPSSGIDQVEIHWLGEYHA